MTHSPLIGITCGTSAADPAAKTKQDRLNAAYSEAVTAAGGIPVILPNISESARVLDRIDGLLLSGGADIDPSFYGETRLNHTVEVDPVRDSAEMPLIREALQREMAVLGICRGIQSLNVALGGTLFQDLPEQVPGQIHHRQTSSRSSRAHSVEIAPGSRLAAVLGTERLEVNTLHHQALKTVADMLRVSAVAPDGIIEAVEIPDRRFVIAVQFHPEEMTEDSKEARRLFAAFIQAAMSG